MSFVDYFILAVLFVLVVLAIRFTLRKKGGGCSGCCANCHADCSGKKLDTVKKQEPAKVVKP